MKSTPTAAIVTAVTLLLSSTSSTNGFNSAVVRSPIISRSRIQSTTTTTLFSTATAEESPPKTSSSSTSSLTDAEILAELERAAEEVASNSIDEECLVDETGGPVDEICVDESLYQRTKGRFKSIVRGTLGLVRSGGGSSDADDDSDVDSYLFGSSVLNDDDIIPEGELLEQGWEARGNSSALRRNAEVWKFALKCVLRALKARKLAKAGGSDEEVSAARVEAATFIRDGLLRLGPT